MKARKFRIPSPEVSRRLQEKLGEMGYKWVGMPIPSYVDKPFLNTTEDGRLKFGKKEEDFITSLEEEINPLEFLKGDKKQTNNKNMKKAFHTFEFEGRKVTTSAVETEQGVSVGYAVCMPQDEFKQDLARKISQGRALSSAKLDSYRLDSKLQGNYAVLKAIATSWERAIRSNPELVIKGFKK